MEPIDLIEVVASHETEVEAYAAELQVSVRGSSLVLGNSVFDKAREVAKIVEALAKIGVERRDFQLRDVRVEVSSGLLGRSSSATYELAITCRDLDKLPDVLGEISSAKQATLGAIKWHFPENAEQRAQWLALCVADANVKAHAMAAAVPARIVGVHRLVEIEPANAVHERSPWLEGAPAAPMRTRQTVEVGFALVQRRSIVVHVKVAYRLASG